MWPADVDWLVRSALQVALDVVGGLAAVGLGALVVTVAPVVAVAVVLAVPVTVVTLVATGVITADQTVHQTAEQPLVPVVRGVAAVAVVLVDLLVLADVTAVD